MERKEFLPYVVYFIMIAAGSTQWVNNTKAKITSYSIIGIGILFSLFLSSVVFVKGELGMGTIAMTYLLYAGVLAILVVLVQMHSKYGDKLERVDKDSHNPILTYEVMVRLLIIVLIIIISKITDDAVKGKMNDVYKLMMMTSVGWLVMILGAGLVGQMYVVVSRYLTDGFQNKETR